MSKPEITLREYLDSKIQAIDKATILALSALEKRLESMNEFRDQLKDQASRFITREELNQAVKPLDTNIEMLREAKANFEGKASQSSVYFSMGIAVLGLIIGLIGLYLKMK